MVDDADMRLDDLVACPGVHGLMRPRFIARATLASIVVCGSCGGDDSGAKTSVGSTGYSWPVGDSVPAEQREAFSDQRISLAEYQGAYFRFEQCANDVIDNVTQVRQDQLTGVVTYETREPLAAPGGDNGTATNDCYQRLFAATEVAFMATDPVVLGGLPAQQMIEFDRADRPCLVHLGVDVPADLEFGTEDYFVLTQRSVDAFASGECSIDLIREPGR